MFVVRDNESNTIFFIPLPALPLIKNMFRVKSQIFFILASDTVNLIHTTVIYKDLLFID